MTQMSLRSTAEIVPVFVEDELKRSYLDYAMSVIVGRALPDVRDGLKPVHRRILFAMIEGGFDYNKPYRKSANVVGQVIAKYHPHGTDPIYEAMVRMAQKFSMRLPLVAGHGNFGSMDGDKAAAMRYTEARLTHEAHFLLEDYDKETVDFQPNYDETLTMPTVLPARFPNLLINGASGIAVGMATNIPPHNLEEVIDACCYFIDHRENVLLEDILAIVKGPDFPTGGIVLSDSGLHSAYSTGRGSFLIRGRHHVEPLKKERESLIITEIPYQVNKASLIERIAELVSSKELEGISDLRDESDRHGVRIVLELKKDTVADVIVNRLYAMTPLQISFGVNMLAINRGQPQQLSLVEVLRAFIDFRRDVVVRRTQFFLHKARSKVQITIGLIVAVQHIDEVIALIKGAEDHASALAALRHRTWPLDSVMAAYLKKLGLVEEGADQAYSLSEEQARAILALRLSRLTNMERGKLQEELSALQDAIEQYLGLLGCDQRLFNLIKEELQEVKKLFPMKRKTSVEINTLKAACMEDLIPCEDMVVTISLNGYIKRVPLATYRSQKRGGRGKHAMLTREEDAVSQVFVADTHTPLLFFTSLGQVYQMKVYELPLGSATSRGKPLVMCFPFSEGERLTTLLSLPKGNEAHVPEFIVFTTSQGTVRKNALEDFQDIRSNGKIAMKLSPGESLVSVVLAKGDEDILLSSRHGKSIRFSVEDLRKFSGRTSRGVRGIALKKGDQVVSMSLLKPHSYTAENIDGYLHRHRGEEDDSALSAPPSPELAALWDAMAQDEQFILCVSERGFGKRTSSYAYRPANRGGQGVATMDITGRTGYIVHALPVEQQDQILLLTNEGQLLRCPVEKIRISARKTQGVRVFRLASEAEYIVSMVALPQEKDMDTLEEEGEDLPLHADLPGFDAPPQGDEDTA